MLLSLTLTQIVAIFIHAIKSGQSIVYIEGHRFYNFKKVLLLPKINFVISNSADPDEMLHYMRHLIWVFTVCQSTR